MKRAPPRRWTAWPPATDPVNDTNDARIGDHPGEIVVSRVQRWNTPSGSPASANASA